MGSFDVAQDDKWGAQDDKGALRMTSGALRMTKSVKNLNFIQNL
jgi:hypothetical protein